MAIAFTKTGQPEEAIRHYKRALELDDSSRRGALRRGLSPAETGRHSGGRQAPAGLPRPPSEGARRGTMGSTRRSCLARDREQPGTGEAVRRLVVLAASILVLGCSDLVEGAGGVVELQIRVPAITTVEVGETLQLTAEALDKDGNPVDAPIGWRTADTVLTINDAGLVTGIAPGTGQVQAFSGSLPSTAVSVTVIIRADTLALVGDSVVTVPPGANSPPLVVQLLSFSQPDPLPSRPADLHSLVSCHHCGARVPPEWNRGRYELYRHQRSGSEHHAQPRPCRCRARHRLRSSALLPHQWRRCAGLGTALHRPLPVSGR